MDVRENFGSSVEYSDEEYEEGEIIDSVPDSHGDILIEYVGPSHSEEIQTNNDTCFKNEEDLDFDDIQLLFVSEDIKPTEFKEKNEDYETSDDEILMECLGPSKNEDPEIVREIRDNTFPSDAKTVRKLLDKLTQKSKTCPVCYKKYKRNKTLVRHTDIQHGNTTLHCRKCNYRTRFRNRLERHQQAHIMFSCPDCPYAYKQLSSLKVHVIDHFTTDSRGLYNCSECSYTAEHKNLLKRHVLIHFSDDFLMCTQCGYLAKHRYLLKLHIQSKHSKPFQCSQCTFSCKLKVTLKSHMFVHTKNMPFSCGECDYKTGQKQNLKHHIKVKHSQETVFKCTLCNYVTYTSGDQLKRHIRRHTGEKAFQCTKCDQRFANPSQMKKHDILEHNAEKPFPCSVCSFSSIHACLLRRHMRIHTGERPFSCKECNYTCNQASHLKIHMRQHTGIKQYICSVCNFQCSWKQRYTKHLLLHSQEGF